jgi:hypothetical protein
VWTAFICLRAGSLNRKSDYQSKRQLLNRGCALTARSMTQEDDREQLRIWKMTVMAYPGIHLDRLRKIIRNKSHVNQLMCIISVHTLKCNSLSLLRAISALCPSYTTYIPLFYVVITSTSDYANMLIFHSGMMPSTCEILIYKKRYMLSTLTS